MRCSGNVTSPVIGFKRLVGGLFCNRYVGLRVFAGIDICVCIYVCFCLKICESACAVVHVRGVVAK